MPDPFRLPQLVDPVRDWRELGLCGQTDPEAFFVEKGGSTREASGAAPLNASDGRCDENEVQHDS